MCVCVYHLIYEFVPSPLGRKEEKKQAMNGFERAGEEPKPKSKSKSKSEKMQRTNKEPRLVRKEIAGAFKTLPPAPTGKAYLARYSIYPCMHGVLESLQSRISNGGSLLHRRVSHPTLTKPPPKRSINLILASPPAPAYPICGGGGNPRRALLVFETYLVLICIQSINPSMPVRMHALGNSILRRRKKSSPSSYSHRAYILNPHIWHHPPPPRFGRLISNRIPSHPELQPAPKRPKRDETR